MDEMEWRMQQARRLPFTQTQGDHESYIWLGYK